MDRPWQHHPHHPVSGNLCPICSTPHFPFCPPHPNPRLQFDHNFTPNFVPNFSHQMGMNRAPYPQMGDPYWGEQRPHMVDDYGNVGMENGYVGSDRSRKRMRVEFSGGVDGEFSENDRRLRLIHDHGGSFGCQYYDGVDSSHLGMYGEHRGRVEHQPGFVPRYGEDHVRYLDRGDPSQVEALGRVGGPQREGLDGYFSNSQGYEHTIGGNSSEFENRNGFHHGSNVAMGNDTFISEKTPVNPVQHHGYGYQSSHHYDAMRQVEVVRGQHHGAAVRPTIPIENQHGHSATMKQGAYGPQQGWQGFEALPPLPSSPAPHIPMDPVGHWPRGFKNPSSPPQTPSSVFPIRGSSLGPSHSLRPCGPQVHPSAQPYFNNSQPMHGSGNFIEGSNIQTSAGKYFGEHSSPEDKLSDKPQILDASHLFKPPNRVSRPDHFVIILRGLPGSGKGYLAKMLRDLEVEHSGNAPRIHSMDDYFMTEVEKVEENSAPKTSARGRKLATKKVLEYCYEPEMLEAYRSSMLKAFKKTLEEGAFTFVIVDDRNLRVADFAQFWATAKRSGYEVYVLEAPYKDPAGCAARNVHGFSTEEVEKMAAEWEETPPLYLRLDVKSLFHGDNLKGNDIEEVDMDMDDSGDESMSKLEEKKPENTLASKEDNANQDGSPREEQKWTAENSESEVKDLGHSKWLGDLDDVDAERTELRKGKSNACSGLLQTYSKEGKSVHWGDKALNSGFSIGALKKANMASLVIGRGAGYNLKSNPLLEEDAPPSSKKSADLRQHHIFEERLRLERQSFKAVFDRRRQRIGGFDGNADDE